MKRKLFLTAAAILCAVNVTACGSRRDEPGARYPETTAVTTHRETTRTEKRTEKRTQSRVEEDVSELASDAAAKGKELMTDAASDVSEAVEERRGEGDYHAGENGKVHESGTTTVR